MISAKLGHFLDRPLAPVARRIKVHPNFFTITGLIVTTGAAVAIVFNPRVGGILILVGGAFDVLDGVVARTNGKTSPKGAFLDSVLDRYADAAIFLAIAIYMYLSQSTTGALLSLGTMIGAFLVSYTRARAEGLGMDCHVGLMERPERVVLTALGCITGYLLPILWGLFVLTHITVFQRIYHVMNKTE